MTGDRGPPAREDARAAPGHEPVRLAFNLHETIHAAWRNPSQTEALDDDFTLAANPYPSTSTPIWPLRKPNDLIFRDLDRLATQGKLSRADLDRADKTFRMFKAPGTLDRNWAKAELMPLWSCRAVAGVAAGKH